MQIMPVPMLDTPNWSLYGQILDQRLENEEYERKKKEEDKKIAKAQERKLKKQKEKIFTKFVIFEKVPKKVMINESKEVSESTWWYDCNAGNVYTIKNIKNRREIAGIANVEEFDISEMYIVVKDENDGISGNEEKDNAGALILKKHCRTIS